jgi:hypothetical protein
MPVKRMIDSFKKKKPVYALEENDISIVRSLQHFIIFSLSCIDDISTIEIRLR